MQLNKKWKDYDIIGCSEIQGTKNLNSEAASQNNRFEKCWVLLIKEIMAFYFYILHFHFLIFLKCGG